ncbi:MAG: N-acetylmuramoyl-L-alanine amidase [Elusimicrobia bacterium]|nr:N-acetylmuramoyl-L-alanine amidase [Elusimicrobiota bacterium]
MPNKLLKSTLNLVFLFAFAAAAHAKVDEVTYMKNGAYVGRIGTYSLNGNLYIDAARSVRLMGGKIYWYPVSGKLMLQNKGNKAVFFMKLDEIVINDSRASMPNPLIVRGGKAFLVMDFFISKHFTRAFGFKLDYNPSVGVLSAQQKINIRSVNYFSYKDKTRVVIYLEEALDYQTSRKENNIFAITIPKGIVEDEDKITVADGVIKSVDIFQENKMARIILAPDDNFGKVASFRLTGPDRLVFDIGKAVKPISQSINNMGADAGTPRSGEAVKVIIPLDPGPGAAETVVSTESSAEGYESVLNIPDKMILDKSGHKRIVIDAGHGGKDGGGKKIFGLKEKELNLLLAKALYNLLKDEDIFDVLMTRTSDVFIPLAERSRIANDFKADIFVSIHANASRDRRKKGFEVYFMSENASDPWAAEVADYENSVIGLEKNETANDPAALLLHNLARNEYLNEGSQLAGLISHEMEKSVPFVNRGVKQAAFYVLRGTYAPGMLVEMGFMTNAKDQKNLNDKKVRAKIASAIYKGIMKYTQMKKWK